VLVECIAAVTVALHGASSSHGVSAGLVAVVVGAVLLVFSVWWWYFENPAEEGLRMSRQLAFLWGDGHYVVFASLGALGAGLQLAAAGSHGTPSSTVATTAGLAVAAYLVVTVALQARLGSQWPGRVTVVCGASVLVLLLGELAGDLGVGLATVLMGVVAAVPVAADELWRDLRPRPDAAVSLSLRNRARGAATQVSTTVTPRIT
jgi:low temperature requirement protein LtrA